MKKINQYLQTREAARFLGVNPTTLRNWESSGKLIPKRSPINKYRLYDRDKLEELLKEIDYSSEMVE